MTGFEPATPATRTRCATKLRYIPISYDIILTQKCKKSNDFLSIKKRGCASFLNLVYAKDVNVHPESPDDAKEPALSPLNANEPADSPLNAKLPAVSPFTNANEPADSPINAKLPAVSPFTNAREPADSPLNAKLPAVSELLKKLLLPFLLEFVVFLPEPIDK